MELKNKWRVILHKEIGHVEIASFRTRREAEDFLLNRKELSHHLTGKDNVYTLEYVQ